jgi:hypothetical protein
MTKKSRSDAALKGWATRRAKQAEADARFRARSIASKKGWTTRRAEAIGTGGRLLESERGKLPVYDSRMIEYGAELGHARTREQAERIAENAASGDDELEDVYKGKGPGGGRAWIAVYRPGIHEPLDDMPSDEWEIGFEYRGADRGSHVDVNIRIAREDGEAFGFTEANNVLRRFRENLGLESHNPIPDGYLMAFIDWRRPRWGTDWQSGGDGDLVAFHAPMYTESSNPAVWSIEPSGNIRLGSVKK